MCSRLSVKHSFFCGFVTQCNGVWQSIVKYIGEVWLNAEVGWSLVKFGEALGVVGKHWGNPKQTDRD